MKTSISETTWHGRDSWLLENETMRTVVVPDLGAKLVSLFDKRSQREWLVGPGDRPLQKVPYGAPFAEQDMSGWDEMFPTIVACQYPGPGRKHGRSLPDHGEVWPMSWILEPGLLDALSLRVEGKKLRYRLTRTLSYSATDTLQMAYELQNLGRESMPYLWAAHPQFDCGDKAQIVLPEQVSEVCNTIPAEWGWGDPEQRFDWPLAERVDGQLMRIDHVGPPSQKQARKFFVLPDVPVNWAGLIRRPFDDWLRLDWDPQLAPYLGLWIDEGLVSHASVAALEPMTGFYDSLELAWNKQMVTVIAPGETKSWVMRVQVGTGEVPFPVV